MNIIKIIIEIKTKKNSNIISNHKLTYILTLNEISNFDEKKH